MTQDAEINIFRCLDFLRDNASAYATAKANRAYLEEYRKTLKAQLMIESEQAGAKSAATQERDAYAHTNYKNHLCALQEAIQIEEDLRWKLVAAQAKIEAWRTIESSRRYESRVV